MCRSVICAVCGAGRTPELTEVTYICGGICIPQVHADVGKVPWNKYSLATRERAVEFSTNNHVNNNVRTANACSTA